MIVAVFMGRVDLMGLAELLNRQVRIDLGRDPLRLIFFIFVIVVSLAAWCLEKSHAVRLNRLPVNRTEVTGITSMSISHDGSLPLSGSSSSTGLHFINIVCF
jgi:hypothetical protein